ncbi:MAG: RibD family protein, partial [Bdellovibrionales bacterium]|nr:RibD family protein [Bdellovibrionales bacterium]
FSHHLQKKEAFIALKVAASMDGAIADHNKKSQWITSEESRSHTHFLRSRYHAILVGKNTIIEDNPSLNVRHAMFPEHRNKVLILNTDLDVLPSIVERKVYKLRKPEDIIFISSLSSAKSLEPVGEHLFRDTKTGVLVLPLEETKLGLNLQQLKSLLPKIGIYDVMVEGGAVTYSSFIEQNAFDHIYLFQAPILLGGEESMLWTSNFSKTIDDKVDLKIMSTKRLGVDILVQLSKK